MQIEILNSPGSAAAKVIFSPGETLTAEGGSMIAVSNNVQVSTTTLSKGRGNIFKAAKRMLAGESFFLNHYTVNGGDGEIYLSSVHLGDMKAFNIQNADLIVQGDSFVACSDGVTINTTYQGLKNLFAGESLFWTHLSGSGQVIFSSFGAIYPIRVEGEHIVDTSHIVAFEKSLSFSLTKPGKSWLSAILGQEGLVCKFKGNGIVWCQSHNSSTFGKILGVLLKPIPK